jgi:hypothetical protein
MSVVQVETEAFVTAAIGEKGLLERRIMEPRNREMSKQQVIVSADAAILEDLRDNDTISNDKGRKKFLLDELSIRTVRENMVNGLFEELIGHDRNSGMILSDLFDTAKHVMIRNRARVSRAKNNKSSSNATQQQQQQQRTQQQKEGELFKTCRKTLRKIAEKAQSIADTAVVVSALDDTTDNMKDVNNNDSSNNEKRHNSEEAAVTTYLQVTITATPLLIYLLYCYSTVLLCVGALSSLRQCCAYIAQ